MNQKELDQLRTMQHEAKVWTERNFPGQSPHQPLMGIVEELGELWSAEDSEALEDAVADIFIFAANYCTHRGLDLADVYKGGTRVKPFHTDKGPRATAVLAGKLMHHQLKFEQGIRGTPEEHKANTAQALGDLLALIDYLSPDSAVALAFRVWRTEVQPRQWRKPEVETQP